jgi:hypothetical protein
MKPVNVARHLIAPSHNLFDLLHALVSASRGFKIRVGAQTLPLSRR